jgi:hypothetical protein
VPRSIRGGTRSRVRRFLRQPLRYNLSRLANRFLAVASLGAASIPHELAAVATDKETDGIGDWAKTAVQGLASTAAGNPAGSH